MSGTDNCRNKERNVRQGRFQDFSEVLFDGDSHVRSEPHRPHFTCSTGRLMTSCEGTRCCISPSLAKTGSRVDSVSRVAKRNHGRMCRMVDVVSSNGNIVFNSNTAFQNIILTLQICMFYLYQVYFFE